MSKIRVDTKTSIQPTGDDQKDPSKSSPPVPKSGWEAPTPMLPPLPAGVAPNKAQVDLKQVAVRLTTAIETMSLGSQARAAAEKAPRVDGNAQYREVISDLKTVGLRFELAPWPPELETSEPIRFSFAGGKNPRVRLHVNPTYLNNDYVCDEVVGFLFSSFGCPLSGMQILTDGLSGHVRGQALLLERVGHVVGQEVINSFNDPQRLSYFTERERELNARRQEMVGVHPDALHEALKPLVEEIARAVERNDRPRVADLLEQHLPWSDLLPTEARLWRDFVDAIRRPDPKQSCTLFRGVTNEQILGSEKQPSLRSKYMQAHFDGNPDGPRALTRSLILDSLDDHTGHSDWSLFLSCSEDARVAQSMSPAVVVMRIDKRRVLPNPFSSKGEKELNVPLFVFPDEITQIVRREKEGILRKRTGPFEAIDMPTKNRNQDEFLEEARQFWLRRVIAPW